MSYTMSLNYIKKFEKEKTILLVNTLRKFCKIENFDIYIKIYFKTRFTQFFKFFSSIVTFFDRKINKSFCFYTIIKSKTI